MIKSLIILASAVASLNAFSATAHQPTISIAVPAATIVSDQLPLTITVNASDLDGDATISKVDFWIDDFQWCGIATVKPFTSSCPIPTTGAHILRARVTDNTGLSADTQKSVTAQNQSPTIAMSNPTNNMKVPMDTDLILKANAHDLDGDATIKKVEYFRDGTTWLGSSTVAPFQVKYSKVASGTHTIYARVSDGKTTVQSTAVSIDASLPALYPDLIVTSFIYSNGVYSAVVKNQGTLDLPSGAAFSVIFTSDGVEEVEQAISNAGLAIGASITVSTNVIDTKLTYGQHSISAYVNKSSSIKELNYANNTLTQTKSVTAQPDLYISNYTYTNGYFSVRVVNRGDAPTLSTQEVRVSFSVDGTYVAYASTTAIIKAGDAQSFSTKDTGAAVAITPGTHTMLAFVDDYSKIAESNESNNKLTLNLAPPEAPTYLNAYAGNSLVSVSFTIPSQKPAPQGNPVVSNGSSITQYTLTASNGKTVTGTMSPLIMTGLTNGVAYTFKVKATNSVGSATSASSNSATPMAATALAAVARATRPSYNTGNGLFVLGNKIYDANGVEFRIRGVNRTHYDSYSPGIPLSGANTERFALDFKNKSAAFNVNIMQSGAIDNNIVPIPGNWEGTCSPSTEILDTIVQRWVDQAATFKTLDKYMILNIANEWGPGNSIVWRDSYIAAIKKLRIAGYTSPIMVTSGSCGQDIDDVAKYAQEVFNSDPQKNVIFDVHVYGGTTSANIQTRFDSLKATNLAIVIGEFGPGRYVGPSPTYLTPGEVITQSDSHGFGWMAWAWDDNSGGDDAAQNYWFKMSYSNKYLNSDDLTVFGKDVVENPVYGMKVKSVLQTEN
jgi:hypothetical protein